MVCPKAPPPGGRTTAAAARARSVQLKTMWSPGLIQQFGRSGHKPMPCGPGRLLAHRTGPPRGRGDGRRILPTRPPARLPILRQAARGTRWCSRMRQGDRRACVGRRRHARPVSTQRRRTKSRRRCAGGAVPCSSPLCATPRWLGGRAHPDSCRTARPQCALRATMGRSAYRVRGGRAPMPARLATTAVDEVIAAANCQLPQRSCQPASTRARPGP